MTAIANCTLLAGPAAKGCRGQVRGVEKTKARPQFDGECPRRQAQGACFVRPSPMGAPCQSGTDEAASFWNGPRLRAAFAAQVLAQALSRPCRQDFFAQSAYRGRAVRSAMHFDESF